MGVDVMILIFFITQGNKRVQAKLDFLVDSPCAKLSVFPFCLRFLCLSVCLSVSLSCSNVYGVIATFRPLLTKPVIVQPGKFLVLVVFPLKGAVGQH